MFVSYAQNFEDVMLWRALSHVGQGFYIDVGAGDPSQDSVTRAFYDRGWRGINTEPAKGCFRRLAQERPRDVNLRLAAAAEPGRRTFYEASVTHLSTFDQRFADQCEKSGYTMRPYRVRIARLSDICTQYAKGPIHFLRIDIEKTEADVLQGMDFARFRPWITVIDVPARDIQMKASDSSVPAKTHESWELVLLNNQYDFVYFDGLNRFYVAREREDLKRFFEFPPNAFDQFVTADLLDLAAVAVRRLQELTELRARLPELQARLSGWEAWAAGEAHRREELVAQFQAWAATELRRREESVAELQARLSNTERTLGEQTRQLDAVYQSSSWKMTALLRWTTTKLLPAVRTARIALGRVRALCQRGAARVLRPLVSLRAGIPALHQAGRRLLTGKPALEAAPAEFVREPPPRVDPVATAVGENDAPAGSPPDADMPPSDRAPDLPERAQRVYAELRGQL